MGKLKTYKESTGWAIQAMKESAQKDRYTDNKREINFHQRRKSSSITLKDLREWNKKRNYKEETGLAVNAMIESAINDPYVDQNPPSLF